MNDSVACYSKMILSNDLLFCEVDSMLSEGHTVTLPVKGRSMWPFIAEGRDKVVLQKTEVTQIGDVVLARLAGGAYVLHRVYNMANGGIILMGDGNICRMERCRQEDISGKVVKIIRNGMYVDCSSRGERYKVWIWMFLRPVRRYVLAMCRMVKNGR